ncbi:hypothetical protein ACJX0J_019977, partial [Zea mays]
PTMDKRVFSLGPKLLLRPCRSDHDEQKHFMLFVGLLPQGISLVLQLLHFSVDNWMLIGDFNFCRSVEDGNKVGGNVVEATLGAIYSRILFLFSLIG